MNAIMLAYAPRNFGSNVVSNKRVVVSKSPSLNTAPQSIEHLRVKFKTDKELPGRTDFDLVSLGRPAGRSMGSGVTRKDPVAVVSRKRCCSSGREEAHRPRRCAASRESAAVCSEVRRVSRAVLRCVFDKCRSVVPMLPLLVLLSAFQGALCARTGSVYVDDQVQNYLSNFGYLPQSNSEAGNLRSEDQLREAISNLQRFGHIPVTGQIDPETRRLLSRPRCGMPDQPAPGHGTRARRFVQQGAVWNHTDLTWSLQRKPQNLDAGGVREELARALAVWSDHSRLTFREINSDKADIVVSFAKRYHDDSYPFDGRGQILAHAFFPGNGRGGDAHFDDEEIWLLRNAAEDDEGTSLFAVAAHEFGHSLGLSHSSVQGALMYPWYQGLKPNFQLPEDDRLGIQNMYGAKEEKMWGKIPAYLPTEPPRVFTTERPDPRPERPRYPAQYPAIYPDSGYPRHRPAAAPRRPEPTPESPPEYPRRPSYPGHRPEHPERRPQYPERRPHYPERRPEHTPTRYNPDRRPSMVTPRPHVPERRPEEHPTRRTNKYNPESKPHVPHHHTTPRTHFPHTTESPYYPNKPDYPRKSPLPKKPYYPPEKPWRQPDRRPSTEVTPTGQTKAPKPDSCNTNYDAVALIRREVFIFKSQYLWRIGDAGVLEGFPTFINRMWSGLPDNLTHVDAVYERPDKKIVFFIGEQYYVFNANKLESGYPRPLTSLGLPDTLEHLNAAMVWGHNGKTYFYNETMYWKFDEEVGKVELDYPRDMSTWRGVGNNIDTVFQWKDGKTYFFKGKGFWKFNDLHMRVEKDKQILSGPFWMGCPYPGEGEEDFYGGNKQPYQGLPPSPTSTFAVTGASSATRCSLVALAVTILFTCIQCRYILDS